MTSTSPCASREGPKHQGHLIHRLCSHRGRSVDAVMMDQKYNFNNCQNDFDIFRQSTTSKMRTTGSPASSRSSYIKTWRNKAHAIEKSITMIDVDVYNLDVSRHLAQRGYTSLSPLEVVIADFERHFAICIVYLEPGEVIYINIRDLLIISGINV